MSRRSLMPDPRIWQTFVSGLTLEGVVLFEVRAKRAPEFPETPLLKPLELQREAFQVRYTRENQRLLSEERLSVRIRARGVRNPLVRITLHAGVLFGVQTPYEPDFEDLFLQNVHTPILWPYVRKWVQDITQDMGLGDGILLPLIVVGGEEEDGDSS